MHYTQTCMHEYAQVENTVGIRMFNSIIQVRLSN